MDPIGGIISGIDTQGLINKLVEAKSYPKQRIEDQAELLYMKKEAFQDVNTRLLDLKQVMLSLRLETTFLSKLTTVSDQNSFDIQAGTEADVGSHSIKISDIATPAIARSTYTNAAIVDAYPNTTNITNITGRPDDSLEGRRDLEIMGPVKASALGSSAESTSVEGTLGASIQTGVNDSFTITVNGENVTVTLDAHLADTASLEDVAQDIEDKVNAALTGDNSIDVLVDEARGSFVIADGVAGYSNSLTIGSDTANAALGFNTVQYTEGSDAYAKMTYKPLTGGNMYQIKGNDTALESAAAQGTMASSLAGGTLSMDISGTSVSITLEDITADTTTIWETARDAETKLNNAMNSALGTTDKTYVKLNVEHQDGTGNDKLVVTNAVPGASVNTIESIGGTAASVLGLDTGIETGTTTEIETKIVSYSSAGDASTFSNLLYEMNDNDTGLLQGVEFFTDGGLQQGTAVLVTDSTLNLNLETPTTIYGSMGVSNGTDIDMNVIGLQNADFDKTVSSSMNGSFTINGKVITIRDYTQTSVSDVLAQINASGAGVIAKYDSVNDFFSIESIQKGPFTDISLGSANDTSDFLDLIKVTANEGGQEVKGNTNGVIDPSQPLSSSNFETAPTSGHFSINGVSIYVDIERDSLDDILDKINNSGANVKAVYSSTEDKIMLSSKQDDVITNTDKIKIGSKYDTSNFLLALNLSDNLYTDINGTAAAGDRQSSNITVTRGYIATEIELTSTSGSGAYSNELTVDFSDGIDENEGFDILAGAAGGTLYRWRNYSGETIDDIDTFIEEFNNGIQGVGGNWTQGGNYSDPGIKAVKVYGNKIRFFNPEGGAASNFTIAETNTGDAAELGFTSGDNFSTGAGATADSMFNALNFAYDVNSADAGVWVRVEDGGELIVTEPDGETDSFIQFKDNSAIQTPINDFFGDNTVTSTNGEQEIGTAGTDAMFEIDGQSYIRTSNEVDDIINDITIFLKGETDGLESFSISNDTDKGLETIAEFIAEYNKTSIMLNPERLDETEKKYLTKISDEDRVNMTYEEILDYTEKYNKYTKQEYIRKDSSLKSFYSELRNMLGESIEGVDSEYNSLGVLGISHKNPNTGLIDATKNQLYMESTDKDEILESLQTNYTLKDALRNDAEEVYKLFGQIGYEGSGASEQSKYEISPTSGLYIPEGGGDLIFSLSDGTNSSGQIRLIQGNTYSQEEILDLIDGAGIQIKNDVYDNRVNIEATIESNKLTFKVHDLNPNDGNIFNNIYIEDYSSGTNNLSTILGIEAEGNKDFGTARQVDDLIDSYIGIQGTLNEKIKPNGTLDRQLLNYYERIEEYEDRLDRYKQTLWRKFNYMEEMLSNLQSQSSYLQDQLSAMNGGSSSGGS